MPDETNQQPKKAGEGAWIFLSHSNKDFEQVRAIRNELERRGHKPLMFFLKCLESDDARLPELLKAEITARSWFILCDSPNAATSKWVQEEVAMIQGMAGKVFKKVDLSKGFKRNFTNSSSCPSARLFSFPMPSLTEPWPAGF